MCLNPTSFDTWLSLALCYSSAANELLMWSANEIVTRFKDIREYQLHAFHCFSQAANYFLKRKENQLDNMNRTLYTKYEIASTLWAEFGFLCHSIATKPMDGAAAASSWNKMRAIWNDRFQSTVSIEKSNLNEIDVKKFILQTGVWAFKRASHLDSTDWQYPFMVARLYEKLNQEPMVISLFTIENS